MPARRRPASPGEVDLYRLTEDEMDFHKFHTTV
ncbi:hypothetical protein L483_26595 [Pseudomonas putida H8234]|nr:hypothetical protein L483_26595 [Pseudomonas putida H8234]